MADIKISLKMDEQLRKDLQDILVDTVKEMPSTLGEAVRSGVVEHKVPLRQLAYSINEAREKALLALLPEELRPKKEDELVVKEEEDDKENR
ncbi:MAG: hypothetical protein Q4D71_01510 [Oscillospiraceae bacterium]|nr:hypothetical protein [Oscillospiraceae bacterium]MBR0450616.1 hypothetical protein [Oscillospiraceae bacterium]MDO5137110.1 hypothetical protein [Oscillospiraceae bacterium]